MFWANVSKVNWHSVIMDDFFLSRLKTINARFLLTHIVKHLTEGLSAVLKCKRITLNCILGKLSERTMILKVTFSPSLTLFWFSLWFTDHKLHISLFHRNCIGKLGFQAVQFWKKLRYLIVDTCLSVIQIKQIVFHIWIGLKDKNGDGVFHFQFRGL